ncbi:hypothetical protein BJ994_000007 [Arthrobacter pigmenti]|uniref:DUF2975 domain-containing protein n=1 Tax=Arthrobacter pigmenti TaxID=271432 RepID=A0A846RRJ4_9MICC|nr:DUF2975 domain-containing protein [Arthrobacter pigmenti]NJC20931.1 hypothetical protein [Arthrobacter pigmenti]
MTARHISLFRVLIGVCAIGALLAQVVVVPQVAADYADRYPEVAHLELPYLVAVVVAIGGFEVALLAAWRLLAAAKDVSVGRSKRWINLMAASLCFTALVLAGVCVHAGSVENIGGPAMLFGVLASVAIIAGVIALRSRALPFYLAADRGYP